MKLMILSFLFSVDFVVVCAYVLVPLHGSMGGFCKVDLGWVRSMRGSDFVLLLVSMCVWRGRNMRYVGISQDPGVLVFYKWSPLTYDWLIAAWPLDIFCQMSFCPDVVGCWWIARIVLPLCWQLSLYMILCVTSVFCRYAWLCWVVLLVCPIYHLFGFVPLVR